MSALPLLLKAAMALFLVGSVWWAFFGPPPDRRDLGTAKLWGATSAVLYLAGFYALFAAHSAAPLLVGGGVISLCLAFWHARGEEDDGDDGGGRDDGPGPLDWDEFDRARRDWDRPLVGA